jgi:hypothetical protein
MAIYLALGHLVAMMNKRTLLYGPETRRLVSSYLSSPPRGDVLMDACAVWDIAALLGIVRFRVCVVFDLEQMADGAPPYQMDGDIAALMEQFAAKLMGAGIGDRSRLTVAIRHLLPKNSPDINTL